MLDLTKRKDFVFVALLFEGSLVGVAAGLGWWFKIDVPGQLTWDVRGILGGLVATVPMLVMFGLANRFPIGPLRKIKQFLHEALGPSLRICRWYDLILVAAMAGIGEELLFRGVLQPLTGPVWSNVLFGLVHFITPAYALLAGLLGGYLAWVLDLSGNLLAPIIAHALYDFVAFLVVARECRRTEIGVLPDDSIL